MCAAKLPSHMGLVNQLLTTLDRVQFALTNQDKESIFDQFSSKQQLLDMLPTKPDAEVAAQATYPDLGSGTEGLYGFGCG